MHVAFMYPCYFFIVFPNSIGAQENSIFAFRFVLRSSIPFAIFYSASLRFDSFLLFSSGVKLLAVLVPPLLNKSEVAEQQCFL